jgi:D-sedoheptulose 7-phosphate isomerase
MTAARVRAGLEALSRAVLDSAALSERVVAAAGRYTETLRAGGTIFFCGNGGSAADAQHIATEYVVRYSASRRPLAALALTTDSSLLTAAANDLGFEQVFARQVEALCRPRDLLSLHSTSGDSPNLLAAARVARARSVATVGFLGRGGGALAAQVDEAIVVPSDDTGRIQVIHLALEHLIVELVEEELARGA